MALSLALHPWPCVSPVGSSQVMGYCNRYSQIVLPEGLPSERTGSLIPHVYLKKWARLGAKFEEMACL